MKKAIAGVLLTGSLAVVGAGLATGTAQADPFSPPANSWCPGQGLPFRNIVWNMNVCHTWYTVPVGRGNVRMNDVQGNPLDSFVFADGPAPILTPPPPPPPAPPHPFCTPRGGLFIVGPICDEIGVH